MELGDVAAIGMGLAKRHLVDCQPGWVKSSVGYHGDDGRLYIDGEEGIGHVFGSSWQKGDRIEIRLEGVEPTLYLVFLRNDAPVGDPIPWPLGAGLRPTIGLRSSGCKVVLGVTSKRTSLAEQQKKRSASGELEAEEVARLLDDDDDDTSWVINYNNQGAVQDLVTVALPEGLKEDPTATEIITPLTLLVTVRFEFFFCLRFGSWSRFFVFFC